MLDKPNFYAAGVRYDKNFYARVGRSHKNLLDAKGRGSTTEPLPTPCDRKLCVKAFLF